MPNDNDESNSPGAPGGGNLLASLPASPDMSAAPLQDSLTPGQGQVGHSEVGQFETLIFPEQTESEARAQDTSLSWGDRIGPKRLRHTHEVIAWMAASGANNTQISQQMNLSPGRVSVLLSNTKLKARIAEIRDKHWGENLNQRFAATAPKAMDFAQQLIEGRERNAKVSERWDAAKWLLEKTTGKPKQEIEVDGGNSIRRLIQTLDTLRAGAADAAGADALPVIDLTPKAPENEIDSWVSENVPTSRQEKK